jgi:hypothetical protein
LVKALFDLVACLAWQDVAADDRTSTIICARLLAIAVDGVLANYHVKIYAQERLFCHFAEKDWPADLIATINELRAVQPKASWLNKAAHAELRRRSVEEQKLVLFGQAIWAKANATRSFLINKLNPHWVAACDLPSGHTR